MPVAQPIQSAAEGPDPKRSVRVLQYGADLIAGKSVGRCKEFRLVVFQTPESPAVAARPDGAVAAFAQNYNRVIQQHPAGNREQWLVRII